MKTLTAIVCLSALITSAFAQGLVNFINTATTLSSAVVNNTAVPTSGSVGSWYYGLLIAAPSTTDPRAFSFSGVYATNLASAGLFSGGNNVQVPGWAAGASMSYLVAIWSASEGHDFHIEWMSGDILPFNTGNFGISAIGTGIAGAGTPASPAYNLFGGATGIQTGFTAPVVGPVPVVPEPSSMAFAALGAAALLIFCRRK